MHNSHLKPNSTLGEREPQETEDSLLLNELCCQGVTEKNQDSFQPLGQGEPPAKECFLLQLAPAPESPQTAQCCPAPSDRRSQPEQRSRPDLRSLAFSLPDSLDSATRVQHIICTVSFTLRDDDKGRAPASSRV